MIYFSGSANGFFDTNINDVIPEDAVEIDSKSYQMLMEGQQKDGCIIRADENGFPVLANPVIDYLEKAISLRDSKLDEAKREISLWQSELLLGIISDNDRELLQKWILYIRQLQGMTFAENMDEDNFGTIIWPEPPED
ncbi:tail fiber assembly protein [Enterobacter hormaechei]|jgi:hypothetical protein|uniref:tail fiber assembly protein n=1 Tax=Enterobacter cloacae complex TaxID=354276 RepID=UPI0003DBC742|nr:tail fiber assembly protein [Enterobacter hormaechei]EKS6459788.1 tail fiber assembly protein [Enterobacter hormaechei]ELC6370615.1 tail fiber assembly protein [Enterobacter hormaechei]ELC6575777.1 tail fiber assembly protein [Enterobacter hormaechei]MCW4849605.1 tail fiber assembly protein [Enterobacter hormaechei subsp. xiangfangensis]MDL4437195.1 tail fiber assembly protein [Enterobacter hormaechei]